MRKKQIFLFSLIPFLIGCQIKNNTLVLGDDYVNRRNIVFHIKCDKKQEDSILINIGISHSLFFKEKYEPAFTNITIIREIWIINSKDDHHIQQKDEILKISKFSSTDYSHDAFSENPTYFANSFTLDEGLFGLTFRIQEYEQENIDTPSLYCPVLVIKKQNSSNFIYTWEGYFK